MPSADDIIAYLAHAGLSAEDIYNTNYYLGTGQVPGNLSERAWAAIQQLGGAGLDEGGVNRAMNYLSTGRDPDQAGAMQRAAQRDAAAQQAAAPAPSLAEDPAYLAFRRQLDDDDANTAASTQTRIDALNNQLTTFLPELARQGDQARQGINGNFESRGVFRSGARLERLGDQQQTQAGQEAQARAGVAGNIADLQAQLAERRRQNALKRSEAGLGTASRLYVGGV